MFRFLQRVNIFFPTQWTPIKWNITLTIDEDNDDDAILKGYGAMKEVEYQALGVTWPEN